MTASAVVDFSAILAGCETDEEIPFANLKVCIESACKQQLGEEDSNKLFHYYEEEDYDANTFYEEFNGPIADVTALEEWDGTTSIKAVYEEVRCILRISVRQLKHWSDISPADMKERRNYLNGQTFDSFSDQDQNLMRLAVVGKKNNVPGLVLLLYDTFCKFHVERLGSVVDGNGAYTGPKVEPQEFCQKSPFVQALSSESSRKDIALSIQGFGNRIMPLMKLGRAAYVLDDDIHAYIEYTLMVQEIIASEIQTASCLPLQIDLVILPKRSVMMTMSALSNMHSTGFEDEEDSDDEEEDDNKEELGDSFYPRGADALLNIFKSFNTEHGDTPFKNSKLLSVTPDAAKSGRLIAETWKEVFPERQGKRFVFVVDRRGAEDQCFMYQLPSTHSAIPRDCSFDNFVATTAGCLVPDAKPGLKARFRGAKHDNESQIFVVSFACLEATRIRMQWFCNGGGIRFYPEYMRTVWPQVFKTIGSLNKAKYTTEYIRQRWKLNTNDASLDSWYAAMAPPVTK